MKPEQLIKTVVTGVVTVPRPYTDKTHSITEGVYATPDFQQLVELLRNIYAAQGLELVSAKGMEITLREYHDNPPRSNQPGAQVPTGSDSGQPADQ